VIEDGVADEAKVGAAQLLGHVRVQVREAFDVRLVDDGLFPGDLWPAVVAPFEGGLDDGAERRIRRAILLVERQIGVGVVDLVAIEAIVPAQRPPEGKRVRIEHDLVGVEAVSLSGIVGTIDAVAIELSGAHVGQIGMPDGAGTLGQGERRGGLGVVRARGLRACHGGCRRRS